MTIQVQDGLIKLIGECGHEDVEVLSAALSSAAGRVVDLEDATHLHGAILQVLLHYAPPLQGEPQEAFTKLWIAPALAMGTKQRLGR